MPTFTKENCKDLQETTRKIDNLLAENIDGALMHSQMMFLGELIKEFANNPIVANSGIIFVNSRTTKFVS